jgi:hypothetical protein
VDLWGTAKRIGATVLRRSLPAHLDCAVAINHPIESNGCGMGFRWRVGASVFYVRFDLSVEDLVLAERYGGVLLIDSYVEAVNNAFLQSQLEQPLNTQLEDAQCFIF